MAIPTKLKKVKIENTDQYFHWVWGDNLINHPGKVFLINLEYGMSIRIDYGDAYFADFDAFKDELSDVQFLSGARPDDETVENLLINAWNFMSIQERLDEEMYGEDD